MDELEKKKDRSITMSRIAKIVITIAAVVVAVIVTFWGRTGSLDESSSGIDKMYRYASVCVNTESNERVSDMDCRRSYTESRSRWYYYRVGDVAPAVGQIAVGGTFNAPRKMDQAVTQSAAVRMGGQPIEGGTVVAVPIQVEKLK